MISGKVYLIKNAPKQHGDLWVELSPDNIVTILNPAGTWWRDKIFTLDEFNAIIKGS